MDADWTEVTLKKTPKQKLAGLSTAQAMYFFFKYYII